MFEPVFGDQPGVIGRATGHDGQAIHVGEIDPAKVHGDLVARGIGLQHIADHGRLFGDFLRHIVFVATFLDPGGVQLDLFHGAVGAAALCVIDFGPVAGDNGPVAFFQIGDLVGHRCQRDGVRAHEHFAVSVADGQGAALAGGDHQIVFAVKQEAQRKGSIQLRQRGLDRFFRGLALRHIALCQQGDGLCVRFGRELKPFGSKLITKLAEVLDDAVMHNGHVARAMWVGVVGCRRAVGGPTGMADAGFARKRVVDQRVRQVHQLADGATTTQLAFRVDGCNARTIIAAVFQPLQCFDKDRRCFVITKNPYNTTHFQDPF